MGDYEDIIEGIVLANKDLNEEELLKLIKKDEYIKKYMKEMNLEDENIIDNIRDTKLILNLRGVNLKDNVKKYVASKQTAMQKVVVKVSPNHTPEEIADLLAVILPESRNEILLTYWEGDVQAFLIPIQYKNEIDNSNLKYEIIEASKQKKTAEYGNNEINDFSKILTNDVKRIISDSIEAALYEGNDQVYIDIDKILSLYTDTLTPKEYDKFDIYKAEEFILDYIDKEFKKAL